MLSPIFSQQVEHHLALNHAPLQTTFDASIPPVLTIRPGELVHVETLDCFSGKVTPEHPSTSSLKRSELNPITGPIFVDGALPGDLLAVSLHDIQPIGLGVACCGTHSGQLSHLVSGPATRFFDISNNREAGDGGCQTTVTMQQHSQDSNRRISPISFPASPMLGVIGVAPPTPISTMPAGPHGGNLDNKHNGIGATIYLPVNHPGALLSMGDMHAAQGDGEISGTGVEISGHVLLSCQILKRNQVYDDDDDDTATTISHVCQFPVTETATHWMTHGVLEENIPETTKLACEEAARILMGQWGFTPEEAFIFLSVQGDLGLCQSCHPDQGTQIARMKVPKLQVCPRPFKCLLEK